MSIFGLFILCQFQYTKTKYFSLYSFSSIHLNMKEYFHKQNQDSRIILAYKYEGRKKNTSKADEKLPEQWSQPKQCNVFL